MPSSFWCDLYDARRDWAFGAHEAFLAPIPSNLKDNSWQGKQKKHVTAVLYGSTQVGKTTLILSILGVKNNRIEAIADVLRGGQGQGDSATATALRYRRSRDHLWHIGGSAAPGLDEAAVTDYFKELREKVEDGMGVYTFETGDLVDVYLPSNDFDAVGGVDVDIRLIDLPGLNADNENEREYVRSLARRHVPYADLVILVGVADRLAFLEPGELQLEELKDWWMTPHRFRIVCTRGFAPDDIAKKLRENDYDVPMEAVRELWIKQFDTLDSRFPSGMKQFLYVVELGESLRAMEKKDPLLFVRVAPLVGGFMCSLVESIKEAAAPWFRLKSAWDLPSRAQRLCQSGTREWMRDHHQRRRRLLFLRERLVKVQESVPARGGEIDVFRADLARVTGFIEKSRTLSALDKRFAPSTPLPSGRTVEAMREGIDAAIAALNTRWESVARCLDKPRDGWPGNIAQPALGPSPRSMAFDSLLAKLDDYRVDAYWFDSSWNEDMDAFRIAYKGACIEYARCAGDCIRSSLKVVRRDLINALERHENKLSMLREIVERRSKRLDKELIEWSKAKDELSKFWQSMQGIIKYGEHFTLHMQRAVETECRSRRDAISNERNPAKRFQQYLLLPILETEYMNMKKGIAS